MTCLRCNSMENTSSLVTLHDGRVVCNTCSDYRTECEARELLRLDEDARTDALLERVKKRGSGPVNELRTVMASIYRKERAK